MKYTTALGLGLLGGLAVTGYYYRRGIDKLQFQLAGISVMNTGSVRVTIAVFNPSPDFAYPVPKLTFAVFDSNDKYLGTLESGVLQWINKGTVSYLVAWIKPDYIQLVNLLSNALNGTPLTFFLTGYIQVNRLQIPVDTELNLATNGL
jgi:hypothetical protein